MSAIDFLKDILIGNRQNAVWNIGRVLGFKHPERSEFWKESVEHYQGLDVKGKRVLVLGSDFGVTPMYFLSRGAKSVVGYSLWKQYFFHPNYEHRFERFSMDKINANDYDVMSADCEGCEYLLSREFLSKLEGYVICFHDPVENISILEYARKEGVSIRPPPAKPGYKPEIAIYRKKVMR
jgi:hypothetical protein